MGIARPLVLVFFASISNFAAFGSTFVANWLHYVETEAIIREQDIPYVKNYLNVFDALVDMEESNLQVALTAITAYLQLNSYVSFEDFWTGITLFYIYWSELAEDIAWLGHFRFTLFKEILFEGNTKCLNTANCHEIIYFNLADILHRFDNETGGLSTSVSWLKKKIARDELVNDRIDSIMSSDSVVETDVIWPFAIVEFYKLERWDEEKNILYFYQDLVKLDRKFGRRKNKTMKGFFLSPPVSKFLGPRLLLRTMHLAVLEKYQELKKLVTHNDSLDEDLFAIILAECLEGVEKMRLYGGTLLYIMLYEEMLGEELLFSELMHPKDYVDNILHTNRRPAVLVTVQEYEKMEQILMKLEQHNENLEMVSKKESIQISL